MKSKDRTKLNFRDFIAIGGAVIATIGLLIFTLIRFPLSGGSRVMVYYQNRLIETYNLDENKTITFCRDDVDQAEGFVCDFKGMSDFQGPIVQLEIKERKIRITDETSSKKLCSYQGAIKNANTPLICLPNSFMAVITGGEPEFDN